MAGDRQTAVMWFRRDLRLDDHPALAAAAAEHRHVVPLFVDDPAFDRAGAPRRAALASALAALDRSMHGSLVRRRGTPARVVAELAVEVDAAAVYVTRDAGPYGHARDAEVAAALRGAGRRLVGIGTPYAVAPGEVTKADGSPYAVFTPFSKAWRAAGWERPEATPEVDWLGRPDLRSDRPLRAPDPGDAPPDAGQLGDLGEEAAEERWAAFRDAGDEGLDAYDARRDVPAVRGTSRMSVHLRWGTIHPRRLLADLGTPTAHEVFAKELAWRDFAADVLLRRPETAWHNLDTSMDAMAVDRDRSARTRFRRWAEGRTGFPFVDAGMRQLLATGWMHNRVRMVTASFLVKDLHLPWQWGAAHFLRHLVDGDLASNNHGFQWTAGTGTDAAPFFRVFNPVAQGERFDPRGEYVRTWLPDLDGVGRAAVHQPSSSRRGDYPAAMLDHAAERAEALARYKAVSSGRRGASTR